MAELGSGGGGDVGDTTNVADDTDIEAGGPEGIEPAEDVELDSRTGRRLRRDANSDPMAEQTEPEPEPQQAPPEQPADDGPTAGGQTGEAADTETSVPGETETATNGAEPSVPEQPSDVGLRAGDQPGETPEPDPEPSPPSDSDTPANGAEPSVPEQPSDGGLRAGDQPGETPQDTPLGDVSDPPADDGPSPGDLPEQPVDNGLRAGDQPAEPAATEPSPGPSPGDVAGAAEPQQGIEESGATEQVEQQAQEFEQQVLAENPWLDEEDVAIQLVGTEEGPQFRVELTEGAEQRVSGRQQDVIEGLGIGAGSLAATGGTDPAAEAQEEARAEQRDALEGIGFFEEQAEQEQAFREKVEEDIEGQVGAGRAERAGITNPTLREGVVEDVDLEAGEDFTLDIQETPSGRITVDAELTEEFQQEEAERAFERALLEETGVRLEPGEEFRVVEGEEGGFEAEVTEAGEERVRREQPEQFGDIDWSFGLGDPKEDEVEAALGDASAAISEAGRDFASALFDEGGVASESLGEEVLTAVGREDLGRDYEETLRSFGKGVAQSPFAIGNVPAVGGAVLEGIEFTGYAATTDPGRSIPQTKTQAEQIADVVVQEVRESPAEFTGLAIGTLGASYGIMRAAANVGPRTGLAARYAIQPGEELAGTTGFRVTRRLAGQRRAQQLFPNREPLIFSEEFAIRQARRLREGAGPRASAARARATNLLLGEPEARVDFDPSRVNPMRRTTERPGLRTQAGRAATRVEDAFSGRTFAGVPVPVSRTEIETSPEAETEALMDQLEGPLRRMEESRIREAQRTGRIGGPGRRGPPSEFRGPATRDPLETGRRTAFETETDALRRLEIAGQPTTEDISSALATEVASQELMTQSPLAIETEVGRSDVLTETETEQEQLQELRLELGLESETELEQRLELEAEAETETELEFEFETETEVETEPFGGRTDRRDEDDPFTPFGESRELLERDLLNPLTGE